MIFMQYALTLLMSLALVLQLAVSRAPDLVDEHGHVAARRILLAGLSVMVLWLLWQSYHGIVVHPVPSIGAGLFSLAECMFCITRLSRAFDVPATPRTIPSQPLGVQR